MVNKFIFLFFLGMGIIFSSQAQDKSEGSLKDVVIQEDVKGVTSGQDGGIHFQSKKALFNRADKTLEMQDSVRIENDKGVSLETQRLKWDQEKDEVATDDEVTIERKDSIQIKGKGLNAKPSLKKTKIGKDVEVRIPQKNKGFIMITCKGPLEIDYQEGKAVFYNDVKVNQEDSQIFSDKATVYFDGDQKTLKKIVAEGEVRIVRGKDTSFSDKAIYQVDQKKLILKGNPRLVIFPEEDKQLFE